MPGFFHDPLGFSHLSALPSLLRQAFEPVSKRHSSYIVTSHLKILLLAPRSLELLDLGQVGERRGVSAVLQNMLIPFTFPGKDFSRTHFYGDFLFVDQGLLSVTL